jgi:hypothetical protein
MRHSDIKATMAYHANVDEAVEEAVLGPRCNGKRNTLSTSDRAGA